MRRPDRRGSDSNWGSSPRRAPRSPRRRGPRIDGGRLRAPVVAPRAVVRHGWGALLLDLRTTARVCRRMSAPVGRLISAARAWPDGSACSVGHRVDGDGNREDDNLVLARRDLDAVGVTHPEPALGDLGDLGPVVFDVVLV